MENFRQTIIVVEDKKEEQKNALRAIKTALDDHGEEYWLFPGVYPERQTVFLSQSATAVGFAPNLKIAKEQLGFFEKFEKECTGGAMGVLTDLMFPKESGGKEEPNGLAVITLCIHSGIPVVVCSDTHHHDVGYLDDVFPILGKAHPRGKIPVILDKKDWAKAVNLLLGLMAKKSAFSTQTLV